MKRFLCALALAAALVMALLPAHALSEPDTSWRWICKEQTMANGDINLTYPEVLICLPAGWAGLYEAVTDADGVSFYHAASRALWQAEGDDEGGLLFRLTCSEDEDFRKLPSYHELGGNERGYYYLIFPTDAQAYPNEETAAEYEALQEGIEAVKEFSFYYIADAATGIVRNDAFDEVVDFDEAACGYEGVWISFDQGFKLYIPSAWAYHELTDEEIASHIVYHVSGNGMTLLVAYGSGGGMNTVTELAQAFTENGYSSVRRIKANELACATYENAEAGFRGAGFFLPSDSDYVGTILITPMDVPEGDAEIADSILDSLSPVLQKLVP